MEMESPLLLTNGRMLKAGVNNSFLLHSFTFRRMWKQCCSYALLSRWRVCICVPHKSAHLHSAGVTSCSTSSVFKMLSMYHSPKWVYDNSFLQRNLSTDRKRKSNWMSCSWELDELKLNNDPLGVTDIYEVTGGNTLYFCDYHHFFNQITSQCLQSKLAWSWS